MTICTAFLSYVVVERPARLAAQRVLRRGSRHAGRPVGDDQPLEDEMDVPELGPSAAAFLVPLVLLIAVLGLMLPAHFRPLPGTA